MLSVGLGVLSDEPDLIRRCTDDGFQTIYRIVNDAAQAYKGVIPPDCWKDPYMPREELRHEIAEASNFGDTRMNAN